MIFFQQIPFMNPFPGPRSVIVMDNCRIHHGGGIGQIFKQNNVVHMYLPPYSPNFNPIEKGFAVIKSDLKRTQPLSNSPKDSEVIWEKVSDIFTPDLMEALFRECGY
jgi:transposase